MKKSIEDASREYTEDDRKREIANNNGCYSDQQTYAAFIAGDSNGYARAIEEASEGFDEWDKSKCHTACLDRDDLEFTENSEGDQFISLNEVDRLVDDLTANTWIASRLSAQKEIDEKDTKIKELERKNEALMEMQIEDDAQIIGLIGDLKWAINTVEYANQIFGQDDDIDGEFEEVSCKIIEIRTKHKLDKEEG